MTPAPSPAASDAKKIKVRVYHAGYGCETGCCGHWVELTLPDGTERDGFDFDHPFGGDARAFALEHARDVVKQKFPECYDSIDWDNIDFEDVNDNC